jgi:hypothetical protein
MLDLSIPRLGRLMRQAVEAMGLNLRDMVVLTEAATGPYAVTPVIAALANAGHVYAFTRSSRHGTVSDVTELTLRLASSVGVADRISIIESISPDILGSVDIVTNSGHLRPITADTIECLPSRAVIALMFEAWEFRAADIDIAACRRCKLPIVGVNENDPAVDVFSYLGPLAVKLLHDAGLPVYRNRVALLCDNTFSGPLLRGLRGAGADVSVFSTVESVAADCWDAIVVALRPASSPRVSAKNAADLARNAPRGALLAQFWGDVDRDAVDSAGLQIWPPTEPRLGHMAILLSALGPDPIVRLQTGGLRAAEFVFRGGTATRDSVAQLVDVSSPEPHKAFSLKHHSSVLSSDEYQT